MRKSILWMVAVAAASAAVMTTGGHSQAGVIAPLGLRAAADELLLTETVQFRTWKGHRYCWYPTRLAGRRLVPMWLQVAARLGLGWSGGVARVETAANPPPRSSSAHSSVEARTAGIPTTSPTPCYKVMTSLPVAAGRGRDGLVVWKSGGSVRQRRRAALLFDSDLGAVRMRDRINLTNKR